MMSKYRKWVLTLGIMAVTPGITMAGPLDVFKSKRASQSGSSSAKTNQRIADNIASALRVANISGYDIAIEQRNGTAMLTGKVADQSLKDKAYQIVGRVPGVKRVDNRLEIGGPTTGLPMADSTPAAEFFPIQQVQFENSAPSLPANNEQSAPENPFGPGPAVQDNQAVAQNVAGALGQAGLSGYDVEVRYADGTVHLLGMVRNAGQRARAEQAASSVAGVTNVENRLQVAGMPPAAAGQPFAPQQGSPFRQVAFQQMAGQQQPPMMPGNAAPPQQYRGAGPGGVPMPISYGHPGAGAAQSVYNSPNVPDYAWPSYASYPNYSQVAYPKQYSASAWPYIGPFYPYPQIPLGWRQVQLEWDDGSWNLNFRPRTDRWWWFLNPKNW